MTTLMGAAAEKASGINNVFPLGGVPDHPEYPYAVFAIALGGGEAYTLDSSSGMRHGLLTLQTFGRTADSAIDLMDTLSGRFLDTDLVSDDWTTTALRAVLKLPRVNREAPDSDPAGVTGVAYPMEFTATPTPEEG